MAKLEIESTEEDHREVLAALKFLGSLRTAPDDTSTSSTRHRSSVTAPADESRTEADALC
jgi:hypothetical protein